MKIFGLALAVILAGLQYRLWIDDGGITEVRQLEDRVAEQVQENTVLEQRNRQLAVVVTDLKHGLNTIEARARREFGMIRRNEIFYQMVEH